MASEKTKGTKEGEAAAVAEEAKQKEILNKLSTVYTLIEGDPKLGPLLDELPDRFKSSKAAIEGSLERLRDPAKAETIQDFELILVKLGSLVTDRTAQDSSLNGRLQNILVTYGS
jgi:hypothetical protein